MRIKKGFVLRQVCGESVVMGEGLEAVHFGKILALNETSAWLWQQAVALGDFTTDALAGKLCEVYDVQPAEAQADVAAIVAEWQEMKVVE